MVEIINLLPPWAQDRWRQELEGGSGRLPPETEQDRVGATLRHSSPRGRQGRGRPRVPAAWGRAGGTARESTDLPLEDAELLHHTIQEADHRVHSRTATQGLLQLGHHHGDVARLAVDVLLRGTEALVQCLVGHLQETEDRCARALSGRGRLSSTRTVASFVALLEARGFGFSFARNVSPLKPV